MTASEPSRASVHVWTVRTDVAGAPAVDDELGVLSSHERARADTMTDDAARRDFVVAHALVRRALSRHAAGCPPERWAFDEDEVGRPFLVGPAGGVDLRFSLSHASGVVACAIATGVDCGVDVEPVEATGPRRRVLTPEEVAVLDAEPAAAAARYAQYWTVKEAYGKARGLGFLLPFDELHVMLGPPPRLDDRRQPPDGGSWHVELWSPTPRHAAALAVLTDRPTVVHHCDYPV